MEVNQIMMVTKERLTLEMCLAIPDGTVHLKNTEPRKKWTIALHIVENKVSIIFEEASHIICVFFSIRFGKS